MRISSNFTADFLNYFCYCRITITALELFNYWANCQNNYYDSKKNLKLFLLRFTVKNIH